MTTPTGSHGAPTGRRGARPHLPGNHTRPARTKALRTPMRPLSAAGRPSRPLLLGPLLPDLPDLL
jgi:hypothetical protein